MSANLTSRFKAARPTWQGVPTILGDSGKRPEPCQNILKNGGKCMKLFIPTLILIVILSFMLSASGLIGVVVWLGNGSDKLPCEYGAHWNFIHGDDITGATLYVNGVPYPMSNHGGGGTWDAYSNEPLLLNPLPIVYAEYTGGHEPNDYFITLSHCNESSSTPTPTPTETSTPTYDPTSTSTQPTITSTNTPTWTPTSTVTFTATPTQTGTPEPTDTPTSTPTQKATLTETPYPPKPSIGDTSEDYTGEYIGTITIKDKIYKLYNGVKAENGSLLLPSSERGASFYLNTIWMHRAWNTGWVNIKKGDTILISTHGKTETYVVVGSTFQPYGVYFEGKEGTYQYLATCYSGDSNTWQGVQLYELKLK